MLAIQFYFKNVYRSLILCFYVSLVSATEQYDVLYSTYHGDNVAVAATSFDGTGTVFCTSGFANNRNGVSTYYNSPQVGFPHTQGGNQDDFYFSCINVTNGNLIYSTWFGGSATESIPHPGLMRFVGGDTFAVTCQTSTPVHVTTTWGTGGNQDIQVVFFSLSHGFLSALHFGGSGNETPVDMAIGDGEKIFLVGTTASQNIPMTQNAFQTQFEATSSQGGFLLIYEAGGTVTYCSYFGSGQNPTPTSISIGQSSWIHVLMMTSTSNYPTTEPPEFSLTTGSGNTYPIVFTLNNNGSLVSSRYVSNVVAESGGRILAETTTGNFWVLLNGNINTIPPSFQPQTPFRGGRDVSVIYSSSSGSCIFSTYYGGAGNEILRNTDLSINQNKLVLIGTTSTPITNFPITDRAFVNQSRVNTQNAMGFFAAYDTSNFVLSYSSFLQIGSGGVSVANGIVFSQSMLWVIGTTNGQPLPLVTSATYQSTNNAQRTTFVLGGELIPPIGGTSGTTGTTGASTTATTGTGMTSTTGTTSTAVATGTTITTNDVTGGGTTGIYEITTGGNQASTSTDESTTSGTSGNDNGYTTSHETSTSSTGETPTTTSGSSNSINLENNFEASSNSSSNSSLWWVYLLIIIFIGGMALLLFILYRKRRFVTKDRMKKDNPLDVEMNTSPAIPKHYSINVLNDYSNRNSITYQPIDISSSRTYFQVDPIKKEENQVNLVGIDVFKKLGGGSFGEVFLGSWNAVEVALKKVSGSNEEFEKEVGLLCKLNHPNIVRFFGMTTISGQDYMVMEYVSMGSLLSLLRSETPFSHIDLVDILIATAKGMMYLEKAEIVHNDLAARNLLVCKEETRYSAKVSDFGMSRNILNKLNYNMNNKPIPVRWASIEVLQYGEAVLKSDVWSFGIVMWETFSKGWLPYGEILANTEVRSFVLAGNRLSQPNGCPEFIYELMKKCWNANVEDRPSFSELLKELQLFQSNNTSLYTLSKVN